MTIVQDPRPPELIPGAMQNVIERDLGEHGMLRFEEAPAGWLTKDGKPRKQAWRRYKRTPLGESQAIVHPSVSTVLDVLAKRALLGWYEERGIAGALEAIRREELDPARIKAGEVTDDDAITVVRDLGLGAEGAMRRAQRRGLTIHDALAVWAEGGDLPNPSDMDLEHRPFLSGLARALMMLDPEPIAVEQITCSPTHGIAGRFDLLARIGGGVQMLDVKTNAWGEGFDEAHAQVEMYRACEQEIGDVEIDGCIVLGIGPGGKFDPAPSCATFDDFLSFFGAYRSRQRITNARAAARRLKAAA